VSRPRVSPDQAGLFDLAEPETRHAAGDPHIYLPAVPRDTQTAAAAAALPRSGTQRAKVLEVIRQAGPAGLTDQEIAVALGLAENSVRPRRLELSTPGEDGQPPLVVDSGERRETSGGNPAIVWRAVGDAS
jgi:hypothetical protein